MGGFHIALNFLGIFGIFFQESGFEDLLIDLGIYGSSTAAKLIQGKYYNRGVRAHKLMFETMFRLKWKCFVE